MGKIYCMSARILPGGIISSYDHSLNELCSSSYKAHEMEPLSFLLS